MARATRSATSSTRAGQHAFRNTPIAEIAPQVQRSRDRFQTGATKGLDWRLEQLGALERMLLNEQDVLFDAVHEDVRKPKLEFYASEIALTVEDVRTAKKNLRRWTRPESVAMPFVAGTGAWTKVLHEPFGSTLVIGAWNYPVMLTLGPLVGAIAAGNTAVIKPSELVPSSAAAIQDAVSRYLDADAFPVVQGGVAETSELLLQRFDLIFFTGSPKVGKVVMAAAAPHLTPVVLELGGKSPTFVCDDADLEVAARRIAWGKFFNAGQTCIGVDYVLVHEDVADQFTDLTLSMIRQFYGSDPQASPDYTRIVNERNLDRLLHLLEGQDVVVGGDFDREDRYLAPTVVRNPAWDSPLMQEEIFGPIMPIITFTDLDAEVDRVAAGEKPLACYVFSSKLRNQRQVLDRISSGGACVNDTLTHISMPGAPFGGVGNSGMGSYHGKDGYMAFTHRRTVLSRSTKFDPSFRYPPYTSGKDRIIRAVL